MLDVLGVEDDATNWADNLLCEAEELAHNLKKAGDRAHKKRKPHDRQTDKP